MSNSRSQSGDVGAKGAIRLSSAAQIQHGDIHSSNSQLKAEKRDGEL